MIGLEWHDNAETAKYTGIGMLGGLASGAPSWKSLRWYQLIGCGAAGSFCASLGVPLIPLAWNQAPAELLYAAAGLIGLGGTVILAIGTAWWEMIQRKNYFARLMNQRLGTPMIDDPTTPIPPTKAKR